MDANSPGTRNYLREERMQENPDMERKKRKRILNRLAHGIVINLKSIGPKKDLFEPPDYENGIYAMDEIKLSYAEALSSRACIPGPRDNRVKDKTRIIKKTRPKWISDLKHGYLQEQELGEDRNTWPEKEAGKRNKKKPVQEEYQVEKSIEETNKPDEEAGRKKTDGQDPRRRKKMIQEETRNEDRNIKSLTLNGRTIKNPNSDIKW